MLKTTVGFMSTNFYHGSFYCSEDFYPNKSSLISRLHALRSVFGINRRKHMHFCHHVLTIWHLVLSNILHVGFFIFGLEFSCYWTWRMEWLSISKKDFILWNFVKCSALSSVGFHLPTWNVKFSNFLNGGYKCKQVEHLER